MSRVRENWSCHHQGCWDEQSTPGMEGLFQKRSGPNWDGLGFRGCKSTEGHLKIWSLIAFGKIEVGKGLMGAHGLIKVFCGNKMGDAPGMSELVGHGGMALRTGVRRGFMHWIMVPWNREISVCFTYTRGFQGEEWDKCSKDF